MYHTVVERTAAPLPVHHLHLIEHHVGAVGLRAQRILHGGEPQLSRLPGGLHAIAAAIRAEGLQHSRLIAHAVEHVQIAVLLPPLAQRSPVEPQLHLVGS